MPVEQEALPLADAMVRLCNPDCIKAVQDAQQMLDKQKRVLDQRDSNLRQQRLDGMFRIPGQAEAFHHEVENLRHRELEAALRIAKDRLEADFRLMVERGQLLVTGVQARPERRSARAPLLSEWIADYRIDVDRNTIEMDEFLWVSIKISLAQSVPLPAQVQSTTRIAEARNIPAIGSVQDMSNEEILAVLEEHARRVVESDDIQLSLSAGISLMPLIKRKLEQRAQNGEMLRSLKEESEALARWIEEKAPSFHHPKAKPIENRIRSDYNRLKAQSKGIAESF